MCEMSCVFFLLLGIFEKVDCVVASKVQFKKMMCPIAEIFLPLVIANIWSATLHFSPCEKYYAIPKVFFSKNK